MLAQLNLGTRGNVIGPVPGMNLAQALAEDRLRDLVLPLLRPEPVRFSRRFETKIRKFLVRLRARSTGLESSRAERN